LLLWVFTLLVAMVRPGFGQEPTVRRQETIRPFAAGEVIRKPTVRREFNRSLLEIHARPAIPFKPFAMVDPHTGQPIAPTATITLPNGKRPTAQQYYDELNSFEKWLSAHGYSLHNTKPNTRESLAEVTMNRALIQRQLETAPKPTNLPRRTNLLTVLSHKSLSTPQPIQLVPAHLTAARINTTVAPEKFAEMNRRLSAAGMQGVMHNGLIIDPRSLSQLGQLNIQVGDPGTLKLPPGWQNVLVDPGPNKPAPQCTHVNDSRHWGWNVGDPNTFAAYVSGTVGLQATACKPPDMNKISQNDSQFTLSAEALAGGTVIGIGGDLLRITGNLGGNQANNTVSANLGVFVLGQDIYSVNKTTNAEWGSQDSISKGVDFSTSIPIPVGPFDIDVTIGAQGSVGLQYSLAVFPNSVNLSGGPFVHTSVYAQAGLNAVVAEAGVGVSLALVKWDMNLGTDAGYGWLFDFYVYDDIYADSDLNLLGGDVYVYAKVFYPCFDPWPDICSKEWDTNVWSWNGVQFNSVLFDVKNIVPLHWT
jgi:hypothetical protein